MDMAGKTMNNNGSSIKLPDACTLLGKSRGCNPDGSLGMVVSS